VKYRQGGVTTLYAIDLLDEALWVPGMGCALIAHEAKKLPEYFDIIRRAYENLPKAIKPKTKTDTKNRYDFTHRFDGVVLDSSIYVATSLRGGTARNLHITESAYIKDRQELNSGSKQAIPVDGRISEETTGNGFNEFYDFYMQYHNMPDTKRTAQDYKTYFYPWVIDPSYTLDGTIDEYELVELEIKAIAMQQYGVAITDGQLLWRRWKKKELQKENAGGTLTLNGDQMFAQEYPLTLSEAFQSGAGSVFNGSKVDSMSEIYEPMDLQMIKDRYEPQLAYMVPQDKEDMLKVLQKAAEFRALGVIFWHLPEKGEKYVIGSDPSDGTGSDNSAIDIYNKDTLEQVAQFYGKIREDELAELLALLGHYYNHAFVGVENNRLTTILYLTKIYDNYYFTQVVDEKTKKKTKKIGWNTNTKTRNLMIDDFIIAWDDGSLTIHSKITQGEMKTFVKKDNGKREHADGKHDDALFAGFVALQMVRFYPRETKVYENASGLN
jgi:hypothetical protein